MPVHPRRDSPCPDEKRRERCRHDGFDRGCDGDPARIDPGECVEEQEVRDSDRQRCKCEQDQPGIHG